MMAFVSSFSLRFFSSRSNKILVNVLAVPAEKLLNYFIIVRIVKTWRAVWTPQTSEKKIPNGVSQACCATSPRSRRKKGEILLRKNSALKDLLTSRSKWVFCHEIRDETTEELFFICAGDAGNEWVHSPRLKEHTTSFPFSVNIEAFSPGSDNPMNTNF